MIGFLLIFRAAGRGIRNLLRDPQSRALLALASALIAGGTLFYRRVEDLSWVDAFYFTIVTLTTVGYGDIAPQTTTGKLFTTAYLLIGIGILVALVSEVAGHVIRASADRRSGSNEPAEPADDVVDQVD